MEKVTLPNMAKGPWVIERFTIDRLDFHAVIHGRLAPPVGQSFTRLLKNGRLIMSDTPAEMRDHRLAVSRAAGHCLLNGLGLGMVLKNMLLKPEVTDITVVEIDQDLIDLVAPHYPDPRVTIVCADALIYKPPKGQRYGCVWNDIWGDFCADNLKDMMVLHRRYGRISDWQGSWGRSECEHQKRQNRRSEFRSSMFL